MFGIKSKTFKINNIKLSLTRIDLRDDPLKFTEGHVLLQSMLFGQRFQRHGRRARHLNGAKVTVIFITPHPQNITRFKVRFALITNGNSLTPGQNVILEALKKVMSFGCMVLFPEDEV